MFSPQENYLLGNDQDPTIQAAVNIYHIPTGNVLREFPLHPVIIAPQDSDNKENGWPHTVSIDSSRQALGPHGSSQDLIFETPSARLLDKRSLAAGGMIPSGVPLLALAHWLHCSAVRIVFICEIFANSRTLFLLAQAPEAKNTPGHVDLIEIPVRKQL